MNKLQIIKHLTFLANKESHNGHVFGELKLNRLDNFIVHHHETCQETAEDNDCVVMYCEKCRFGIEYDPELGIVSSLAHAGCPENKIEIPDMGDSTTFSKNGVIYTIVIEQDEQPDLSYLGTWSDQKESEFSIENDVNRNNQYKWFNPTNTEGGSPDEMMKWGKQNYDRAHEYDLQYWSMRGIVVDAHVNGVEVGSSSCWGYESDMGDKEFLELIEEHIGDIEFDLGIEGE